MIGWFGLGFMAVLGVILIGLAHLENHGKLVLNLDFIKVILGSCSVVGLIWVFVEIDKIFFS